MATRIGRLSSVDEAEAALKDKILSLEMEKEIAVQKLKALEETAAGKFSVQNKDGLESDEKLVARVRELESQLSQAEGSPDDRVVRLQQELLESKEQALSMEKVHSATVEQLGAEVDGLQSILNEQESIFDELRAEVAKLQDEKAKVRTVPTGIIQAVR